MTGLEKWNKTQNTSQTIEEAVDTIVKRGSKKGFDACDWCILDGYYCGDASCETHIESFLDGEVEE